MSLALQDQFEIEQLNPVILNKNIIIIFLNIFSIPVQINILFFYCISIQKDLFIVIQQKK
jgi:hypothetical protein